MEGRYKILTYTFVLYALTFVLGLAASYRHAVMPMPGGAVAPLEITLWSGVIFISVFILFTFVMVRFVRAASVSLGLLLTIALLAGTQFVLRAWIAWPYDIIIMGVLFLLYLAIPIVLVHDIAILVGIAGLAGVLGLSITPLMACVLLATLSLYDIISVYRTRHMVVLAGRMMASGAVFGFLIPAQFSGFFARRSAAIASRRVMLLGSGDVGLPLVLAASAVSQSIGAAAMVGVFSLGGLSLMHYMFAHQERPSPMAALPPIAASAILGYVIAILLGI